MDIQSDTEFYGRRVAVCGDDFGMDAAIDDALFALIDQRRMSAVSCLTQGRSFAASAGALAHRDADIGLHLNLTESLNGEPMPALSALIVQTWRGRLDARWIEDQITRQLDAFEDRFGRGPDHVDGHQHVHQLPGVLQPLLVQLRQRYGARRPWLRNTAPGLLAGLPFAAGLKARFIARLGARELRAAAQAEGWRTNRHFLGVYDFGAGARGYAALVHQWLFNATDGDLLMCHPALPGLRHTAHAAQRAAEFQVLGDAALGEWMAANGISVERYSRMGALRPVAESVTVAAVAPAGRFRHLVSRT
ncbi:ChbG/HpnK family deacetylase [Bordetella genomosp. 5]|nr:ChbG/HpnK family deacetylase [Bordetella genomosp. 5]